MPRAPPWSLSRGGLCARHLHAATREAKITQEEWFTAIQFLTGLCYGGFWATVASMLASLHGLGPTAAGLMAIPGAAGVLVSRSSPEGSVRYNRELSEARANAVLAHLRALMHG